MLWSGSLPPSSSVTCVMLPAAAFITGATLRVDGGEPLFGSSAAGQQREHFAAVPPEQIVDLGLQSGPYRDQGLSLQTLRDNPSGIDLGPLRAQLPRHLQADAPGGSRDQHPLSRKLFHRVILDSLPRCYAAKLRASSSRRPKP